MKGERRSKGDDGDSEEMGECKVGMDGLQSSKDGMLGVDAKTVIANMRVTQRGWEMKVGWEISDAGR